MASRFVLSTNFSYAGRVDKNPLACGRGCYGKRCGELFIAEDADGQHHAGLYLVWDGKSASYLMSGGDPSLRNRGATSLCMWEVIKFAATVTDSFDFEGSMLEPVERFFRAFGARQTPYFEVSKNASRRARLAKCWRVFNGAV